MICTFCGHNKATYIDIYDELKLLIEKLIDKGVTTFYNGGYGSFDLACIRAVGEVKMKYPHIKNYIVLAYRDNYHIEKYDHFCHYYQAETIYMLEYSVHPKYAIIERNKWMVDNSDYLIAYVNRNYGGAYNTLMYTKSTRKNAIEIINLADKS